VKRDHAIIAVACALLLLMALFPPWVYDIFGNGRLLCYQAGYKPIFVPPRPGPAFVDDMRYRIDYERLLLQVAVVMTGAVLLTSFPRRT
jgi:hypothetical protein